MGDGAAARPPPSEEGQAAGPAQAEPSLTPAAAAGVVLVLIDGVGDVGGPAERDGGGAPNALPAGATPLQAAATPVLDAIAGVLGG